VRLYLAFFPSTRLVESFRRWGLDRLPALVSWVYLDRWREFYGDALPRWGMLDSGAFTAWKSGHTIDIDELIAETKSGRWDEAVCLDEIGNPDKSFEQALYMKDQGSPAFPVFHIGEPWELLAEYCKQFPKVGLSCRFGEEVSMSWNWIEQCFARAWPHRFHSFGWIDRRLLLRYPWHSADASSWGLRPTAFGKWERFGRLGARHAPVLDNIKVYLELQDYATARWKREWERIEPRLPRQANLRTDSQAEPDPCPGGDDG
jgi:hypothetical protein